MRKFLSVILSSVYKRKMLKISKSGRVIYKKTYFQIKLINYEGVIILSTGETPCGNFRGKSSSLVFMLFAYFYLHHVLDKIPTWKLFTLITLMEKSKAEKNPWVKKRKKYRPKKERNLSILPKKEKEPRQKRQRLLVWPNAFYNLGNS